MNKHGVDIGEVLFGESIDAIVAVATGRSHVIALDCKGQVWSWGANDKGQLGLPKTSSSAKETP